MKKCLVCEATIHKGSVLCLACWDIMKAAERGMTFACGVRAAVDFCDGYLALGGAPLPDRSGLGKAVEEIQAGLDERNGLGLPRKRRKQQRQR